MNQKAQWTFVGIVVVVISGLLGAGLAMTPDLHLIAEGSDAPDFRAAELVSGDTLTLDDFDGDVVLLNIWATWCAPCEREMPSLERLHREYRDEGLKVVAVSVDNVVGREGVLDWIRARNLTFMVAHDRSGRIERDYQTTGVPETFLIDRHGVIIRKVIGAARWDSPNQTAPIRRALGLPAQTTGVVSDVEITEGPDD